ncbi:CAAD domain-containing protein [Leptolyngbya sp. NIES-2104]|uniref:CAAD domain-containing protein n=1 Tax=Leptolyngbya sp. NIES-2104 TaxID=1552121 RepID=UPI0006ECC95A|nr:CAAD domain-containing protein [Leptolyngbya sp. NIES-2104]GAP94824.1 hypothetical protein NIES2104_13410 [Leptolyngbya sp. NIES-2104]
MTTEFSTNSATQLSQTDEQIVEEVMAELAANPPALTAEQQIEAQRRLAWERDQAKIADFFNDPFKYVADFWQQYKPLVITLLVVGAAIFAVKVVLSLIHFVTNLPLISPLLQLIGLAYTAWFVSRYLLKAETRKELSAKVDEIKQGIIGTTEEIVGDTSIDVKKSVMIQKSPEELYQFWRNFENLPRFMRHLEAVKVLDETRSHWVARAPLGTTVEWDAEIIDEKENQSIVWKSLEGAEVDSTGSVAFSSANGSGTEVKVTMKYNPPAGIAGAAVANLFGESPQQQLDEDLNRFKQVMEAM